MAEELSPESKLYVKEEIDKIRKEFKEDLKEAQSKATKAFTTVALIVGLLTCVGVYGIAARAIQKGLDKTTIKELEDEANELVENARDSNDIIITIQTQAETNLPALLKMKSFDQLGVTNDYAWVGDTKFVWGMRKSTKSEDQWFEFRDSFDENCFFVITTLPGYVYTMSKTGFRYQPLSAIKDPGGEHDFWFVAIGN